MSARERIRGFFRSSQNAVKALVTNDVVFDFSFDVHEDVVAELEQVVLYARLGLVDECHQMYEEGLSRYRHYFPIFAEYAAFLVENCSWRNMDKLRELLVLIDSVRFLPDERELIVLLKLFVKLHARESQWAGFSGRSKLKGIRSDQWAVMDAFEEGILQSCPVLHRYLATADQSSNSLQDAVQLQIVETYWTARAHSKGLVFADTERLRRHFSSAVSNQQWWEARTSYEALSGWEERTAPQGHVAATSVPVSTFFAGDSLAKEPQGKTTTIAAKLAYVSMVNTYVYRNCSHLRYLLLEAPDAETAFLGLPQFESRLSNFKQFMDESTMSALILEELLDFLPSPRGEVFRRWCDNILEIHRVSHAAHKALCLTRTVEGELFIPPGAQPDHTLDGEPDPSTFRDCLIMLESARILVESTMILLNSPSLMRRQTPTQAGVNEWTEDEVSERWTAIKPSHSTDFLAPHEYDVNTAIGPNSYLMKPHATDVDNANFRHSAWGDLDETYVSKAKLHNSASLEMDMSKIYHDAADRSLRATEARK